MGDALCSVMSDETIVTQGENAMGEEKEEQIVLKILNNIQKYGEQEQAK